MSPERLQQVEGLFHSARECEPGERGAFLAEACRGDAELRRQVESLLAQGGSGGPMERPAMEVAGRLLADQTVTQLAVGARLGPYQIESSLGAGGMGQVYKARDTRLGRAVAIKIAHQQFSERFEREAQAISALNHPHICTVHDVGPNYLVMELVEGETLAVRIKKGALPIGEVLRYGAQIADALAEAHSKSITHRDLKPGNVMIAKNGVKVLDFGLAKSSESGATITQTGAVMGTLAYMAPEQLEGREADARTDIYALGLMLYEMATGKRAVQGQPPALDGLPDKFAHVVERCLAREPDDRWQTARDVKGELDWAAKIQPASAAVAGSGRHWRYALAALGVVTIAAVWSVWQFRQTRAEEPVTRLQIEPPSGGHFENSGNPGVGGIALSPDGRTAAFVATVGQQTGLWVRPLDGASTLLFPGTGAAVGHPFWSPDGKSIAFSTPGKLQRIDLAGGPPVTLWETLDTGVWLPDGRMVLTADQSGLLQAPSPGGALTRLTELDASTQEVQHSFPQSLPGDRLLYLAESRVLGNSAIYGISLAKPSERVRVLKTNTNALYASGYLLWWNGGTLVAQEFDPATFKLSGEPHPLAEQVALHQLVPKMKVAVSANGYLLYDTSALRRQLQWFDPSGKALGPAGELNDVGMFRLSPDGRRVALVAGSLNAGNAVWVVDENGLASRVTSQQTLFNSPVWSPDGQNMVVTIRSPESSLFRMDPNGSGDSVRLTQSPNAQFATDWSRDGRTILFWEAEPVNRIDLWVLPVTPQGAPDLAKPRPYLRTPSIEAWGRFSPEASPRWVAYQSNESGRVEIYIRAFPEPGRPFRISPGGGSFPAWGPDGRELYYETLDNKLVAVSLKFGAGSVKVSDPRELFALPPSASGSGAPPFDISPDGRRFLVRVETRNDPGLTLVTNWPALIKRGSAR